jgi:hypothetical protein
VPLTVLRLRYRPGVTHARESPAPSTAIEISGAEGELPPGDLSLEPVIENTVELLTA